MVDLDQEKMEAFGGRMMDILNGGMLSLMTSIGQQTGLFEAMAGMPQATSQDVAAAANLDERYVREWLDTMVTGKILDYSPEERTYALPAEHAALLTSEAGPDNMAVFARMIPLLAGVEPDIVRSFREGGGVKYDQYDEFLSTWAGVSAQIFDRGLVERVMPIMPDVVERLEAGIDVLEVGCGTGHATNLLAQAYPNSRFTGYEFRDEAVEAGRTQAAALGLQNSDLMGRDITTMDEPAAYDLVLAFDVIHDQARPRVVLRNIANALRTDGVFLMVDIKASSHVHENLDHPLGPFLYTTSTMHCMTVSLALDGEGLGAMWGEQKALELLAEAGLTNVRVEQVEGDIFNNYYIARKADA